VSPDAIVSAIVGDLADAVGADHIVAVRRRPDGVALEATLVTHRTGVPPTTTVLPLTDLDRPITDPEIAAQAARVAEEAAVEGPDVPLTQDRASLPRRGWDQLVGLLGDLGLPVQRRPDDDAGPRMEILGDALDAPAVIRVTRRVRALHGLGNTLSVPLRTEQGLVGAIVVSRRTHDAWEPSARRLVLGAASEASAALARARTFREAAVGAQTDALTGLPNRRYFEEFCSLLARRRRAGDGISVLMVDIDKFKNLNDRYGHPVGDLVLRAVGEAIARTVRDDDVPARIGGEEFAVLLRNPGPNVAAEVGERVRLAVRAIDLEAVGVPGVTVSVGVANARPDEPIPAVIDRADQALLRAKRGGRDRVVAG